MNSQIKILLADESAVFLEQLRHVLERDPAFVIAGSANDAQRAVELLHRTQPDILILGLLLPERDGVSVLTAANALPRPPMTLALTGALTEQDAQKLEALGVRYMIRKPCKLQAVAACVRKMLAAVQQMSHLSSDAEALIDGVLRELGVPGVLKGCRYLREAALLAAGDLAGAGLEETCTRTWQRPPTPRLPASSAPLATPSPSRGAATRSCFRAAAVPPWLADACPPMPTALRTLPGSCNRSAKRRCPAECSLSK